MSAALNGLLVADFSRVLAGPYATMLLADLGADVVKVERPDLGDDTRAWGPPFAPDGTATYFLSVNRNKRSLTLDLHDAQDAALARELIRRADVVVENFLPGTMERLGLGYEEMREPNPGVVYCSITGFGDGPGASLPGYDLLAQAVGGLMSVTGEPEHPTKAGVALVDVITGLHAAFGILAALRHRDATGEGQRVSVSLLTSLLSGLVNHSSAYLAAGVVPRAMGNRHPSIAPYEVFDAADRPLVIAAGNDRQFHSLCTALGAGSLAADARFATNASRVAHRGALVDALNALLGARPAEEWFAVLTEAGVPCGPINDVAGAFALAEELGLGGVVEVGGVRQSAHPVRFSATPAAYRSPPPGLDGDGGGVREWLGRPWC
ncbi:CoA transferase [Catenulispora sp. NL8]|uniref:CoA transferase n=1 Tax=Catenulispora pinistramenti TaxID=2705254 RepID=A0ABS5KZG0_9ACTN|nr:CoA transferase [Catenulispora pinistramenti]MBS2551467.1 CoA transferase [Catenulispora pinistramenti]